MKNAARYLRRFWHENKGSEQEPRPGRRKLRLGRQRGQALVLFTAMIVVFFGFLALVLDLGLLFGQRRFDQNGADSAALSAAHYLATNVSPLNADGSTVYFSVTDQEAFAKARQYGGADPNNASSIAPTNVNQNPGLSSTNQIVVTLEYATAYSSPTNANWCYSPSGPAPANSNEPACALYNPSGTSYPPLPGNAPYAVRVTVNTTTGSSFLQPFLKLVGQGNTNVGGSSCLRSGSGMAACAQAIAIVTGSSTFQGTGALIPVSTPSCDPAPNGPDEQFYDLWGSNSQVPCEGNFNFSSWNSTVDLSPATMWCDGKGPDYNYTNYLPTLSYNQGGPCVTPPPAPPDNWNRTGFVPDSSYSATGYPTDDVVWWITEGFQGHIAVGNNLPTYLDANGLQGNLGNNIATGFYCSPSGVSADACSTSVNASGTYYFAQDQPGFHDKCPDDYGDQDGAGCRDATIIAWDTPEVPVKGVGNEGSWTGTNKNPDRIRVARLLNFRFYCDHDGNGNCTLAPKSIVSTASNSTVWGRYVAPFVNDCSDCSGNGPSINGNTATLGG